MKENKSKTTPAVKGRQEKTKKVVIPLGASVKSESRMTAHGYETKVGSCTAAFTTPSHGKRISIGDGEKEIAFSFLGKKEKNGVGQRKKPRTCFTTGETRNAHRYFYRDVALGTDLEYLTSETGIKENIIIKERSEGYRYDFSLCVKGLVPRMNETDTEIGFYAPTKEGEETLCFKIPAPFMTDTAGVRSEAVSYALRETKKGYFVFSVIADASFVNDSARVFPVTVDPQILAFIGTESRYPVSYTVYKGFYYEDNPFVNAEVYNTTDIVASSMNEDYLFTHITTGWLLQFVDKNVKKIEIVLHAKPGCVDDRIYVNNVLNTLNGRELRIDYLKEGGLDNFLSPYNGDPNGFVPTHIAFYGADGGEYAPRVEIEYITDEDYFPTYTDIPMPSGTSACFDVRSGETALSFADGVAATAPLGVGLSHVHRVGRSGSTYGKGFGLSLDETLTKGEDAFDYLYTDAMGDEHGFTEYFYYETNGTAVYVKADEVVANEDGELTCTKNYVTYPVTRTLRSSTGWELITKLDGVKNKELHDRYTEEEKKVKQYKEALGDYVKVSKSTGNIEEELGTPGFYQYARYAPDETYMLMPRGDQLSYRALCLQRQTLISQGAAYDLQLGSLTLQENSLKLQQSSTELQMRSNALQKANYEDQSILQTNQASSLKEQREYYLRMVSDATGMDELNGQQLPYAWSKIGQTAPSRLIEQKNTDGTVQMVENPDYKLWCAKVAYYNFVCQHRAVDNNVTLTERMAKALKNEDKEQGEGQEKEQGEGQEKEQDTFYKVAVDQEALLQEQVKQITSTQTETGKQKAQIEAEKANLLQRSLLCYAQIAAFKARATQYYEAFQELLHAYLTAVAQMPVSYLRKDGLVKGFNEAGVLVAIFDSYGNAVMVDRDEKKRVERIYDQSGNGMTLFYENGKLSSLTDLRGDRVSYTYDGDALVTVTYSTGASLHFTYDASGRVLSVCATGDASDGTYAGLTYDAWGRLTLASRNPGTSAPADDWYRVTGGDVVSRLAIAYTAETKITDLLGDTASIWRFDDHENLSEYYETKNELVCSAKKMVREYYGAERRTTVYTAGAPLLYQKPLSDFSLNGGISVQKTQTVYDSLRRPISSHTEVVLPTLGTGDYAAMNEYAESVSAYEYDAQGRLVGQTAEDGYGYYDPQTGTKQITVTHPKRVVLSAYTATDRLLRRESYTEGTLFTHGKTVEEWVYDEKGNLVKSFTYNSLDPASKLYTQSEVDEQGRTVAEWDATGRHKTTFAYDTFGALVSETYPSGATLAYASSGGYSTAITQSTAEGEESQNLTLYKEGRVEKLVNANGEFWYRYDEKRRPIQIIRNDVLVIDYDYAEGTDENGDKETFTTVAYGNGDKLRLTFDKWGNLKQRKIWNQKEWAWKTAYTASYTPDGRLLWEKDAPVMEESSETVLRSYAYDEAGRPVSFLDGVERYTYDVEGRCDSCTMTAGSTQYTYRYAYDTVTGKLSKTVIEEANGEVFSSETQNDLLGRSGGRTFCVFGLPYYREKISYLKIGDHATAFPSAIRYQIWDVTTDQLSYAYDEMGNIREVKENGATVARYAYDSLGRLVREDNRPMNKTTLFSYDASGNILSKREWAYTAKKTAEVEESEPLAEKLYTYQDDRLMSYGGLACEYDASGTPTKYLGKTVYRNPLGVIQGVDNSSYYYDPLNTLAGAYDYETGCSYSLGWDSKGRIVSMGLTDVVLRFFYDHTGLLYCQKGEEYYLYKRDVQGNMIALLDMEGNVVVQYKYDAWGNHKVLDANGAEITDTEHIGHQNPFRYRGYFYETIAGLYYLKSRFYDPITGRFLSPDSVKYLDPETLGGLNLYAYCNNNPVMNVDPEGHFPLALLFGALGILPLLGTVIGGIKGGVNASANGTSVAAGIFGGMGYGALMGAFATGGIASHVISTIPSMMRVAPVLKLAGTGLLNTAINGMYYTFFSDGISTVVESSDRAASSYYVTGVEGNYGYRYISRWERLDYTRSVTGDQYYGLNAFRFYGEYSFHMYAWKYLHSAYGQGDGLFSDLAGSAFHADVYKNKGDQWYRNIVYFLTAMLW